MKKIKRYEFSALSLGAGLPAGELLGVWLGLSLWYCCHSTPGAGQFKRRTMKLGCSSVGKVLACPGCTWPRVPSPASYTILGGPRCTPGTWGWSQEDQKSKVIFHYLVSLKLNWAT